ncbi:MAG: class C sortase [Promicromonosporaceae bacterium]|nr:class C sortase [Promicromonosporaceae bacterium]
MALITVVSGIAAGFPLYPTAADWFMTRDLAGLDVVHEMAVSEMGSVGRADLIAAADAHNRDLAAGRIEDLSEIPGWYYDLLRVPGSEVMSRVTIPTIDQSIIVFHGTSDEVLYRGAGHQFGTSLPVGGPSTHSVITAHSGLSTARFFSRVPELTIGDRFTVSTAGVTKWYEVDQVMTVLPGDYHDYLDIFPGEDYVTLFTCYPVAINSHRRLVRGTRIDPPEPFDPQYTQFVEAGFPWWACLFTGALVGGHGLGRWRFKPAKASRGDADALPDSLNQESSIR